MKITKINRKTNLLGFTLIELLVVIAIIGLLTSIVLVAFPIASARTRDSLRKHDLDMIRAALEEYYNLNEHYPPEGLCTDSSIGCGGCGCAVTDYPNGTDWDANSDLQDLVTQRSFGQIPKDPINVTPYRYWYEPSGNGQSGCLVSSCEWTLCARLEVTDADYCITGARNSDTHPEGGY